MIPTFVSKQSRPSCDQSQSIVQESTSEDKQNRSTGAIPFLYYEIG
jgi:hypothetical protein